MGASFQIHLKSFTLDAYWLAGFFEGDGCLNIYTPKKGPQVLSFILRQADPKVLYKIKDFLGHGSVFCDKEGFWTFTVRNKAGLLKVTELLHGKLILTKRCEQYEHWVTTLNAKYGTSFVAKMPPAVFNWRNAWLTGFADAEGSFNILLNKRKDNGKYRLRLRFYLDQTYNFESMKILQHILGGTLHCKTKSHQQYHRLMVDTFHKGRILLDYFTAFPPQTTCLLVRFIRYARVYRWHELKQWQERVDKIHHLIQLNKRLQKKTKNLKKIFVSQ